MSEATRTTQTINVFIGEAGYDAVLTRIQSEGGEDRWEGTLYLRPGVGGERKQLDFRRSLRRQTVLWGLLTSAGFDFAICADCDRVADAGPGREAAMRSPGYISLVANVAQCASALSDFLHRDIDVNGGNPEYATLHERLDAALARVGIAVFVADGYASDAEPIAAYPLPGEVLAMVNPEIGRDAATQAALGDVIEAAARRLARTDDGDIDVNRGRR